MDPDVMRADSWAQLRHLCETHSHLMARLCAFPAAAELIAEASRKFCSLAPPTTDAELQIRRRQESAVGSVIGGIAHADTMARMRPAVAQQIFAEAHKLVEMELPNTDAEFNQRSLDSSAVDMKISQICHDEAMRQLG